MKKYFLIIFVLVFLTPAITRAYTATLNVDTNTNPVNAIEGTIEIPKNIQITNIYDGNSTILFWVDKPTLNTNTNTIRFSGFTPGGFQGKHNLFSFAGDFSEQDLSKFIFQNVRALANDGKGTEVPASLFITPTTIAKDITFPEVFTPEISQSNGAFNNSYFVSFMTQDKGVGIDHYEYASTLFFNPDKSAWTKIESPLVLKGNETYKKIFIKAIDKSGNERISTIYGPKYFEYMFIGFIIGMLIICALFYILRMFL